MPSDVIKIPLTRGKFALINLRDQSLISRYKWGFKLMAGESTGYAATGRRIPPSKTTKGYCTTIMMHRLILGLDFGDGQMVHHINGDGLDNRRYNLRIVTPSENSRHRKVYSTSKTGVEGVIRDKGYIYAIIRLGSFGTVEQAAEARQAAIKKLGLWNI